MSGTDENIVIKCSSCGREVAYKRETYFNGTNDKGFVIDPCCIDSVEEEILDIVPSIMNYWKICLDELIECKGTYDKKLEAQLFSHHKISDELRNLFWYLDE